MEMDWESEFSILNEKHEDLLIDYDELNDELNDAYVLIDRLETELQEMGEQ